MCEVTNSKRSKASTLINFFFKNDVFNEKVKKLDTF